MGDEGDGTAGSGESAIKIKDSEKNPNMKDQILKIEEKDRFISELFKSLFFIYLIMRGSHYLLFKKTYSETIEGMLFISFVILGAIIYDIWLHLLFPRGNPRVYEEYIRMRVGKGKELNGYVVSFSTFVASLAFIVLMYLDILSHGYNLSNVLSIVIGLEILVLSAIIFHIYRTRKVV